MSDGRTEILSIRLNADEKRNLTEALTRCRSVLATTGQPEPNLSDFARGKLLAAIDAPAIFPGQNIVVSLTPLPTDNQDVVRSLRLALAAAERMSR